MNPRQEIYTHRVQGLHTGTQTNGSEVESGGGRGQKRPIDEVQPESDEEPETPDEVRLWESGFKDRYYESKFDVSKENLPFRQKVALEYVRGLCWVLAYYYQVNGLVLRVKSWASDVDMIEKW